MITSINLGFVEQEDRIFADLVGESESLTFLMTRRLVRRFIGSTAALLANSSPMMAQAPVHNRKDVIILEHQMALQDAAPQVQGQEQPQAQTQAQAKAAEAAAATADTPRRLALMHKISIEVEARRFVMTLSDGKDLTATLSITRPELHRLLATIHRLANAAEWDLGHDAAWLADVLAESTQPPAARC